MLKRFRGYEVKTEGDAFMVVFFTPLDALLWCIGAQHALLEHRWPPELERLGAAAVETAPNGQRLFAGIRVRMGVHTGFPNCRRNPVTARMDYFGPVVNRSARVADSAHGGQVVCTQEVADALRAAPLDAVAGRDAIELELLRDVRLVDLGAHPYKGIAQPVQVFQVNNSMLGGRAFPPLRTEKAEAAEEEEEEEAEVVEEDV